MDTNDNSLFDGADDSNDQDPLLPKLSLTDDTDEESDPLALPPLPEINPASLTSNSVFDSTKPITDYLNSEGAKLLSSLPALDLNSLGIPKELLDPNSEINKKANQQTLDVKGINWSTPDQGRTTLLDSLKADFYDVDYDPDNKQPGKIEAANVFGRKFTRDQLERTKDGRRLLDLMQMQKSGDATGAGFWSGFLGKEAWTSADIPFLGTETDIGLSINEAINVSNIMKRMQNGGKVSDDDALAVRRYMLENEVASDRSFAFKAGNVIHTSIPFAAEMGITAALGYAGATAGAVAGAAAGSVVPFLGTGIGAVIGGIIGGSIGLVPAVIRGAGRLASRLVRKSATKALTREALAELGQKTVAYKYITPRLQRLAVDRLANESVDSLAARGVDAGERKILGDILGSMAPDARRAVYKKVQSLSMDKNSPIYQRAFDGTVKMLMDNNPKMFADTAHKLVTESLATKGANSEISSMFARQLSSAKAQLYAKEIQSNLSQHIDGTVAANLLLNGSAQRLYEGGLDVALQDAALRKAGYVSAEKMSNLGFFARHQLIRDGLKQMSPEEIEKVSRDYVSSSISKALGDKTGEDFISQGIAKTVAGKSLDPMAVALSNDAVGYSRAIADVITKRAVENFTLKYGEGGFSNGIRRFGSWVEEGMVNGVTRWDNSLFGGIGTVDRATSALGSTWDDKIMNGLKEAARVALVEAPVRQTVLKGEKLMVGAVASTIATGDPFAATQRGQLGIQMKALETGDKNLMDSAKAIAIGSDVIEYISEGAGRSLGFAVGGIVPPGVQAAMGTKLGLKMRDRILKNFGPEAEMLSGKFEDIAQKCDTFLNNKLTESGLADKFSFTHDEMLKFVSNGGKAVADSGLAKALESQKLTVGPLIRGAFQNEMHMTNLRAGISYGVVYNLMKHGITPQSFGQFLEKVGYDGIIEEMSEERYGDFFRGLLGLDDNPSDQSIMQHVGNAMKGLFPDPDQLAIEAVSFAFPALTHVAINHAYSSLGSSIVTDLRAASDRIANIADVTSQGPVLVVPGDADEVNRALQYRRDRRDLADSVFGSSDANNQEIVGNVEELFKKVQQIQQTQKPQAIEKGNVVDASSPAAIPAAEQAAAPATEQATAPAAPATEQAATPATEQAAVPAAPAAPITEQEAAAAAEQAAAQQKTAVSSQQETVAPEFQGPNGNFLKALTSKDLAAQMSQRAQDIITGSSSYSSLQTALTDMQADKIFGQKGVDAIKREWQKQDPDNRTLDKTDPKNQGIEAIDSDATNNWLSKSKTLREAFEKSDKPSTVSAEAKKLSDMVTMPIQSEDQSIVGKESDKASRTQSIVRKASANSFRENIREQLKQDFQTLAEAALHTKYNMSGKKVWGRSALMRLIGIVNAVSTGDLSLAAENPVKWAMQDAGLPHGLLFNLLQMEERAMKIGRDRLESQGVTTVMRNALADQKPGEETLNPFTSAGAEALDKYIEAGRPSMDAMLDNFTTSYLTAKSVLAVSKSDLTLATMRVLSNQYRHDTADGNGEYAIPVVTKDGISTVKKVAAKDMNFHDPEMQKLLSQTPDFEKTQQKIKDTLADMVVSNVFRRNGMTGLGSYEDRLSIDMKRAFTCGTDKEITSVILNLPAFREISRVHDLSFGAEDVLSTLDAGVAGRIVNLTDLLALHEKYKQPNVTLETHSNVYRDLDDGDTRAVLQALGIQYYDMTPEEIQMECKKFLNRCAAMSQTSAPDHYEDAKGNKLDIRVTVSSNDNGAQSVQLSFSPTDKEAPVIVTADTRENALLQLKQKTNLDIRPVYPQIVFTQLSNFVSDDASSMLMFLCNNRDSARSLWINRRGGRNEMGEQEGTIGGFEADLYPPFLRKVKDAVTGKYDYQYPDTDAGRRDAADQLRREMELAYSRNTDNKNPVVQAMKAHVFGTGKDNPGYETVADRILRERFGVTRQQNAPAVSSVKAGSVYVANIRSLSNMHGTMFVSSDFSADGDGESMLRQSLTQAIINLFHTRRTDTQEIRGVIFGIANAFQKAAEELASNNRLTEQQQTQIRNAAESCKVVDAYGRVNAYNLATVASSLLFFSGERSLKGTGNGFFFGPELALIADRARGSAYLPLFSSLLDEALGGNGYFNPASTEFTGQSEEHGLARLLAAFGPSRRELYNARKNAVFAGADGKLKADVSLPSYVPYTSSTDKGPMDRDLTKARFMNVKTDQLSIDAGYSGSTDPGFTAYQYMQSIATSCKQCAAAYSPKTAMPMATVYAMLTNTLNQGGDVMAPNAEITIAKAPEEETKPVENATKKTKKSKKAKKSKKGKSKSSLTVISNSSTDIQSASVARLETSNREDGLITTDDAKALGYELLQVFPFPKTPEVSVSASTNQEQATAYEKNVKQNEANIIEFLQGRGVSKANIKIILAQYQELHQSDITGTDIDQDYVQRCGYVNANTDADEDGTNDEDGLRAQISEENKTNAVIANRDLQAISNRMFFLFPSQRRNYTAIMSVFLREVERLSNLTNEKGKIKNSEIAWLNSQLNQLRSSHDGKNSVQIISALESWQENSDVDAHLLGAETELVQNGCTDLAMFLTALQKIPLRDATRNYTKRRAQAFRLLSQMYTMDSDIISEENGSADTIRFSDNKSLSIDSLRGILVHSLIAWKHQTQNSPVLYGLTAQWDKNDEKLITARRTMIETNISLEDRPVADSCLFIPNKDSEGNSVQATALDLILNGHVALKRSSDGKDFTAREYAIEWRDIQANIVNTFCTSLTASVPKNGGENGVLDAESIKAATEKQGNPKNVAIYIQNKKLTINYSVLRATAQAFVNALMTRMTRTADALDFILLGDKNGVQGNELSTILRDPRLKPYFINQIENAVASGVRTANVESRQQGFNQMVNQINPIIRLFQQFGPFISTYSATRSAFLRNLLFNTTLFMAKEVAQRSGDSVDTLTKLTWDDLIDFLQPDNAKKVSASYIPLFAATNFSAVGTVQSTGNFSTVGFLLSSYQNAMVRPSDTMFGRGISRSIAPSRVTVTQASKPPMVLAIEDNLLAKLQQPGKNRSVRDEYLANDGRFEDGTKLSSVMIGARVDGKIIDQGKLSYKAYQVLHDRYVDRGDSRNLGFELFHGEKGNVYSIQLPEQIVNLILADIQADKDYTQNNFTNAHRSATDAAGKTTSSIPGSLQEATTPEQRESVYDAVFSVLATAARCDQIDPKRIQILVSQGIMFTGWKERSQEDQAILGDTAPQPGVYFGVSITGKTANTGLGMYLNTGWLVETQRSISTDSRAVSFKNHLYGINSAFLNKGQSHDIGLGLEGDPETPCNGYMAAQQRRMRRNMESLLGMPANQLERPVRGEKMKDTEFQTAMDSYWSAVKQVKAFLNSSTLIQTDLETLKAGAFGSNSGFSIEKDSLTVTLKGKKYAVKVASDGTISVTEEGKSPVAFPVKTEVKNGAVSLLTVIPAIMNAAGESQLTAEEVNAISATFRLSTGEIKTGVTLAESGILGRSGETLSFMKTGNETVARFFTRDIVGQIVANPHNTSTVKFHSPAATNYVRDQEANALRLLDPEKSPLFNAIQASRLIPLLAIAAQEQLTVDDLFKDDAERIFAFTHPNSYDVQTQIFQRLKSALAKAIRPKMYATHSVLCASGISASIDQNTGAITYSEDSLLDNYTRDAFTHAAMIYSSKVAKALMCKRSYMTAMANINDPTGCFRYGWNLNSNADKSVLSEFKAKLDNTEYKNVKEMYTRTLKQLDALDKNLLTDSKNCGWDTDSIATLVAFLKYCDENPDDHTSRRALSTVFTDYTGKSPNTRLASFSDLFFVATDNVEHFDFGALGFLNGQLRTARDGSPTTDGKQTVYLGGSFFSGDRRPSGNYEAASGLCRVQSPVTYQTNNPSKIGSTSLYILDPVLNTVQGSDTDGDSASAIVMCGGGFSQEDRNFLDTLMERMSEKKSVDALSLSYLNSLLSASDNFSSDAQDILSGLAKDYPQYVQTLTAEETGTDRVVYKVTERFNTLLSNAVLQTQIDSYRQMDNASTVDTQPTDVQVPDTCQLGRHPISPNAVSTKTVSEADAQKLIPLWKETFDTDPEALTTMTYADVFKKLIFKISGNEKFNLLDPKESALRSQEAIDASSGRGVAVRLEAAIEHIYGYLATTADVSTDAMKAQREEELKRALLFNSHLDGIANALFDVTKDLFAPKAGWRKQTLSYLVGSLIAHWEDAPAEARGNNQPDQIMVTDRLPDTTTNGSDDLWWIQRLVQFAKDSHDTSTFPGILSLCHYSESWSKDSGASKQALRDLLKPTDMDKLARCLASTYANTRTATGLQQADDSQVSLMKSEIAALDNLTAEQIIQQLVEWTQKINYTQALAQVPELHDRGLDRLTHQNAVTQMAYRLFLLIRYSSLDLSKDMNKQALIQQLTEIKGGFDAVQLFSDQEDKMAIDSTLKKNVFNAAVQDEEPLSPLSARGQTMENFAQLPYTWLTQVSSVHNPENLAANMSSLITDLKNIVAEYRRNESNRTINVSENASRELNNLRKQYQIGGADILDTQIDTFIPTLESVLNLVSASRADSGKVRQNMKSIGSIIGSLFLAKNMFDKFIKNPDPKSTDNMTFTTYLEQNLPPFIKIFQSFVSSALHSEHESAYTDFFRAFIVSPNGTIRFRGTLSAGDLESLRKQFAKLSQETEKIVSYRNGAEDYKAVGCELAALLRLHICLTSTVSARETSSLRTTSNISSLLSDADWALMDQFQGMAQSNLPLLLLTALSSAQGDDSRAFPLSPKCSRIEHTDTNDALILTPVDEASVDEAADDTDFIDNSDAVYGEGGSISNTVTPVTALDIILQALGDKATQQANTTLSNTNVDDSLAYLENQLGVTGLSLQDMVYTSAEQSYQQQKTILDADSKKDTNGYITLVLKDRATKVICSNDPTSPVYIGTLVKNALQEKWNAFVNQEKELRNAKTGKQKQQLRTLLFEMNKLLSPSTLARVQASLASHAQDATLTSILNGYVDFYNAAIGTTGIEVTERPKAEVTVGMERWHYLKKWLGEQTEEDLQHRNASIADQADKVTNALTAAFGTAAFNTKGDVIKKGVRITRLTCQTEDNKELPTNILKMENFTKSTGSDGKNYWINTVTYITLGEFIPIDLTNPNNDSQVVSSINQMLKSAYTPSSGFPPSLTEEQYQKMTPPQRQYLLTSLEHITGNMIIQNGESISNVRVAAGKKGNTGTMDSQCLMVLTGTIRLTDDETESRLFHEYFHQMYDTYTAMKVISDEDRAALTSFFSTPNTNTFDEEAAADDYSHFILHKIGQAEKNASDSIRPKPITDLFKHWDNVNKAFLTAVQNTTTDNSGAIISVHIVPETSENKDALRKQVKANAETLMHDIENTLMHESTSFAMNTQYLSPQKITDENVLTNALRMKTSMTKVNNTVEDAKQSMVAILGCVNTNNITPQFRACISRFTSLDNIQIFPATRDAEVNLNVSMRYATQSQQDWTSGLQNEIEKLKTQIKAYVMQARKKEPTSLAAIKAGIGQMITLILQKYKIIVIIPKNQVKRGKASIIDLHGTSDKNNLESPAESTAPQAKEEEKDSETTSDRSAFDDLSTFSIDTAEQTLGKMEKDSETTSALDDLSTFSIGTAEQTLGEMEKREGKEEPAPALEEGSGGLTPEEEEELNKMAPSTPSTENTAAEIPSIELTDAALEAGTPVTPVKKEEKKITVQDAMKAQRKLRKELDIVIPPTLQTKKDPGVFASLYNNTSLAPVEKMRLFFAAALSNLKKQITAVDPSRDWKVNARLSADFFNQKTFQDNILQLQASLGNSPSAEATGINYCNQVCRQLLEMTARAFGVDIRSITDKLSEVPTGTGSKKHDENEFASNSVTALAVMLYKWAEANRTEDYITRFASPLSKTKTGSIMRGVRHASADFIFGRALALTTAAPSEWGKYVYDQAEEASRCFHQASVNLQKSIDRITQQMAAEKRETPTAAEKQELQKLQSYQINMDHLTSDVIDFVVAVANGQDLHGLLPFFATNPYGLSGAENKNHGNLNGWVLRYVTGAAQKELQADGSYKFVDKSGYGYMDLQDTNVQTAIRCASDAFSVALAVRKVVQMTDSDHPAIGSDIISLETLKSLPDIDKVDFKQFDDSDIEVSPQVILQLPGDWLARDMSQSLNGCDLRATMTDTRLRAITESVNAMANNLDLLWGAGEPEGERVRMVTMRESNLGFDETGAPVYDTKLNHKVLNIAAVRGYLSGVINADAQRVGKALDKDDINITDFTLQAIKALVNGDDCLITKYSFPNLARDIEHFLSEEGKRENVWSRYAPENVLKRTSGFPVGAPRASTADIPTAFDVLLERLIKSVPKEILDLKNPNGLYNTILNTVQNVVSERQTADVEITNGFKYAVEQQIMERLTQLGLIRTSTRTHQTVMVISTDRIIDAWKQSAAYQNLLDNGRTAEMLDPNSVATVLKEEANKLHSAALHNQYLSDSVGMAFSPLGHAGIWFEQGPGHHQRILDQYYNAHDITVGVPSPEDQMNNRCKALSSVLFRHLNAGEGHYLERRAFQSTSALDPTPHVLVTIPQISYMLYLLGKDSSKKSCDQFLNDVATGLYKKNNPNNHTGLDFDLNTTTIYDFDTALFKLSVEKLNYDLLHLDKKTLTKEAQQNFIDLASLHKKLDAALTDRSEAKKMLLGRINSMTETEAFDRRGIFGNSKTVTQCLRGMAESVVAAERFRGCLVQMLTSAGTNGLPNLIVKPTLAAEKMFPDQVWAAIAKLMAERLSNLSSPVAYDNSLSGVENMRNIAASMQARVKGEQTKDGDTSKYMEVDPTSLEANGVFDGILCRKDDTMDNGNVLNKAAEGLKANGSEVSGYLRQLFASAHSPSVWSGWAGMERVAAWSKAMSVQMSAFFAIATRFESGVAATGFWETSLGFSKVSADGARKWAEKMNRHGGKGAFQSDATFLCDYLNSMTSNDPFIQDMRELCDLIGMPLTDSITNPSVEKIGAMTRDIDRMSAMLAQNGHKKLAYEVRHWLRAMVVNPSEYAFANVLNGVKMAVVAQTMRRLREECKEANRPFDPVRELRKRAGYINSEIGGIQPEQFAWMTPNVQRLLRLGMFSWSWTFGAWQAGGGDVVTDLIFGGHTTTRADRQRIFIRWLRMIGIIKVGIPIFMQVAIKALAKAIRAGLGEPPDPDRPPDPLGIETMPWLCFANESKVGTMCFDITPLLKIGAELPGAKNLKLRRGAWPYITTTAGALLGSAFTRRSIWGTLAGAALGYAAPSLAPVYVGAELPHSPNNTNGRRYYMHFGKQSDEFFRWFTSPWEQMTSKLSLPLQKVIEGLVGTVSGNSQFTKYKDLSQTDRWLTLSMDPNRSALANFFSSFVPFSIASVAGHPDAGVIGVIGPVQMGASKTGIQKRIEERLKKFSRDDKASDIWASPKNHKNLRALSADILREAQINGIDPKVVLDSALGSAIQSEYIRFFNAMPKSADGSIDAMEAASAARSMWRLNRKLQSVKASMRKRYLDMGVDWKKEPNDYLRRRLYNFLSEQRANPWITQEQADKSDRLVPKKEQFDPLFFGGTNSPFNFQTQSIDTQQDAKGGVALAQFLATDKTPDTLFGIPIIKNNYQPDDLAFFKENPKAAGFYDMGNDNEEEPLEPKQETTEGE